MKDSQEKRHQTHDETDRAIMCTILQPRSEPSHICARRWMPMWLCLALANVAVGVALSMQPERANDLHTIRRWTHEWLIDGRDIYANPYGAGSDYPPHAIVALSPLSLVPSRVAPAAWTAVNLLLALMAPVLAARLAGRGVNRQETVCLVLLFLAWSGTRTLLQFTLLTVTSGLAAIVTADRRPVTSGVLLAVALMKPHIGAPFLLWTLFTRRWKPATIAVIAILLASLAWCARVGAHPVKTAVKYIEVLGYYYTGDASLVGVSQLRPLIAEFAGANFADLIASLVSFILLAAICREGSRAGFRGRGAIYPAPAMAAVWSLLTFYHLTYGFVLLLPAFTLLLWDETQATRRSRLAAAWVLQALLVLDVPGLGRRLVGDVAGPVSWVLGNFHRLTLVGLLIYLWVLHGEVIKGIPQKTRSV